MPILYVCEACQDGNPEVCGYPTPQDIFIAPDGRWLCDGCWDDQKPHEDGDSWPVKHPPKYIPAQSST